MKQKTVVISCAPPLNQVQSAGLQQLFKDFESKGCRVFYYGNALNTQFDRYTHKNLSHNKILYKVPFYWVLRHIDHDKWITRIAHHYPPADQYVADYKLLKAIVRSAVQYFCAVKPDLFICWNPHSPTFGPIADTARLMGINTGAIEWGLLPGTYILDKNGTLADSEIFNHAVTYSNPEKFRVTGEQIFNELSKGSTSFYQQNTEPLPEELNNLSDRHTKVLLIGIDMVDSGSLPETGPDRLGLLPFHKTCSEQAIDIGESDADFRVILKPHPSHNYNPQSGKISPNCWIVNSNPDELIKLADVVVCSGSKMEFSALLAGKPLVNIGAGILYNKGCSYEIDTPKQLREQILQAKQQGVTSKQLQALKLFLGFLQEDYLYVYNQPHSNATVIYRMFKKESVLQSLRKSFFK